MYYIGIIFRTGSRHDLLITLMAYISIFCFTTFRSNKVISILLTIIVIGVNLYFVISQVEELEIRGTLLVLVCKCIIK